MGKDGERRVYKRVDPELLLDRLNIVYIEKNGVLWASCPHPDHNDRSPSWRMIADQNHSKFGQHRCYGCGWGGWPVHLVKEVLGCDQSEAAEWLNDMGVDPPLPFAVAVTYQASKRRFQYPSGVQVIPLSQWPERARNYLLGDRAIQEWQVQRWDLGVAPGEWHEELNPLAGRIVFPVRSSGGKLISYTARAYNGSKRRYREASKEEGADLGAVFGELYWPEQANRRVVVVTEGAIDALAVERMFPYSLPVGGIFGSQLAPGHISRLSTFKRVLMCTDPDKAGNTVAATLEQELQRWTQVVRVKLPQGEDPGSLSITAPHVLKDAISSVLHGKQTNGDRVSVSAQPGQSPRRIVARSKVRFGQPG